MPARLGKARQGGGLVGRGELKRRQAERHVLMQVGAARRGEAMKRLEIKNACIMLTIDTKNIAIIPHTPEDPGRTRGMTYIACLSMYSISIATT